MVKNVARVLQVANRLDVPLYLGADEPLLGEPIDAAYVSAPDTPVGLLVVVHCGVWPLRLSDDRVPGRRILQLDGIAEIHTTQSSLCQEGSGMWL